ncbi:hypothetical protein N7474_011065 [Penicillium riverlandense]|uniref:uncharacterized protein n=1 Tax=Penicillium riverlandense TaxID=1903569 RepID=UPI002548317C|nr:uncharacterized protein N7474_011065 [Penicillium riverlandense]KAJ5805178.1 hypothetical protein N7474_011065 [Penicillium riverlandense]
MPPPLNTLADSLGHNTLGKADLIVQSVLLALSFVAVGLRLWSRRSLQVNDWLVLAATLIAIGRYVVEMIMVLRCGLGLHAAEVVETGGPEAFVQLVKMAYIGDLLWTTAVALVQLSILHYYVSVFSQRTFKWFACGTMTLSLALWIASFLATALFCIPPSKIWLPDTSGHCGDRKKLEMSCTISELVLGMLVLILPIPMLWRQQHPPPKKAGLTITFVLGAGIITIIGVRLKYIISPEPEDPTYGSALKSILTATVLPLGIIVSCLPVIYTAIRSSSRRPGSPMSARYWKTTVLSSRRPPGHFQIDEPEMPLVTVTQPVMVKGSDFLRGHIQVTSDWEIHSTRDSSRLRDSTRIEGRPIREV